MNPFVPVSSVAGIVLFDLTLRDKTQRCYETGLNATVAVRRKMTRRPFCRGLRFPCSPPSLSSGAESGHGGSFFDALCD